MSFPPTQEMLDRPKQTIHAAELFQSHAPAIAHACLEASPSEVVVAVVDQRKMLFAGIWIIPRGQILDRIAPLDNGDWSLLFTPGTSRPEIEERALGMARLAFRRWEVMRRWIGRRGFGG
jgi:hypothetical protein